MSNEDGAAVPVRESRHIRQTHAERLKLAWCGVRLTQFDWTFQDVDHAAYAGQQFSSIPICPACVDVVTDALRAGKGET